MASQARGQCALFTVRGYLKDRLSNLKTATLGHACLRRSLLSYVASALRVPRRQPFCHHHPGGEAAGRVENLSLPGEASGNSMRWSRNAQLKRLLVRRCGEVCSTLLAPVPASPPHTGSFPSLRSQRPCCCGKRKHELTATVRRLARRLARNASRYSFRGQRALGLELYTSLDISVSPSPSQRTGWHGLPVNIGLLLTLGTSQSTGILSTRQAPATRRKTPFLHGAGRPGTETRVSIEDTTAVSKSFFTRETSSQLSK